MVARDDNSTDAGFAHQPARVSACRIYPLQDANENIRTLTSNTGTVLGRIDYDNYGNWTFLTSAYASGTNAYGWLYGFQQAGDSTHRSACTTFSARQVRPVNREVDDAETGVLGWE